jgi:hypothetical protein
MEKNFHLGRLCFSRAQLYHQLHHWKFQALQQIQAKINEIEESKKRRVNNETLVRRLVENQDFIASLYMDYQILLDEAENFQANKEQT